jgi:hypothetical protein
VVDISIVRPLSAPIAATAFYEGKEDLIEGELMILGGALKRFRR